MKEVDSVIKNNMGTRMYREVSLPMVFREDLSRDLKEKKKPALGSFSKMTIQDEEITE